MDLFGPILRQIALLWERVDRTPVARWGTVTTASPLSVTLDPGGDPAPASSAVGPLPVGARVYCVEQNRRVVVVSGGTGGGGGGDWVPRETTTTATPSRPLVRVDLDHTLDVDDPNQIEFRVNGTAYAWMNEWGGFRARPGAHQGWTDALFRAIIGAGDPVGRGSRRNSFEQVDRRSPETYGQVMWGVQLANGVMQQGGQDVGAIYMLQADQTVGDIPDSLPPGTVVMRMQPDPDEV